MESGENLTYLRVVWSEVGSYLDDPDPRVFDDLVCRVFAWQFERNEPYRRFCELHRCDPGSVRDWRDVPAVPVLAFKQVDLVVSGAGEGLLFQTSGTTQGLERRGTHRVPDPSIYRRAALKHFEEMVLPDGARPRLLVLAPSIDEEPHSSLCQMIRWIDDKFGDKHAEYFLVEGVLDSQRLAARLRELEPMREPLLLIGVTHAFQHFINECRSREWRFRVPYASRIVDTGGSKGRAHTLSRTGFLRACWETFGVPGYYVANEYGMTEMCSQFYDSSIRDHVLGRKRDRQKIGPAWVRSRALEPVSLTPVSVGERGLLTHFDLANIGSVCALRTEDVGRMEPEGFTLLGRAPGAEVRGCSLLLGEVAP